MIEKNCLDKMSFEITEEPSELTVEKVKKKRGRPSKAELAKRAEETKLEEYAQEQEAKVVKESVPEPSIDVKRLRFELRRECLVNPDLLGFSEREVLNFSDDRVCEEHGLLQVRLSCHLTKQISQSFVSTVANLIAAGTGLEALPEVTAKNESLSNAVNSYFSIYALSGLGDMLKMLVLATSDLLEAYKLQAEKNALKEESRNMRPNNETDHEL